MNQTDLIYYYSESHFTTLNAVTPLIEGKVYFKVLFWRTLWIWRWKIRQLFSGFLDVILKEHFQLPLGQKPSNFVIHNTFLIWNLSCWLKQFVVHVILFEIDSAFFYTNLHELFCQVISWTNLVNSGKMDNCWISCQVMADMKKVYDNLIIINLYLQKQKQFFCNSCLFQTG